MSWTGELLFLRLLGDTVLIEHITARKNSSNIWAQYFVAQVAVFVSVEGSSRLEVFGEGREEG